MMRKQTNIVRRRLLQAAALGGGGFAIGFALPASAAILSELPSSAAPPGAFKVTAWVRITPDNQVTIVVSQAEIGQGISTTLPAILADELGADWSAVRLAHADFAPAIGTRG